MQEIEVRAAEIPKDVAVVLQGKTLEVKGEKGKLMRDFSRVPVRIQLEEGKVVVSSLGTRRKSSALVGTVCSHVQNMMKGVTKGYTYKLKIVFSHFPISVKVDGKRILIENFIGERNPRLANVVGDTKVIVKGDDVIVQGISLEEVSQTAANIEQATKVRARDPRKFLDGVYIHEKLEGIVS